MARVPKTIVRDPSTRTPVWSGVVLLTSLVGVFGLLALVMGYNHHWTDSVFARMPWPWPGPATSLAADPGLAEQLRLDEARARFTTLADETLALVVEATVTNDSFIPVRNVVFQAVAFQDEQAVRGATASCGVAVSDRLLRRMPRSELAVLGRIEPDPPEVLEPGQSQVCQVAVPGVPPEAQEVAVRIASAEPAPNHPSPTFRPWE
jgi:hypothetical protein